MKQLLNKTNAASCETRMKVCRAVYDARHDYLHGNPIKPGASLDMLNHYAAVLYRLVLTEFLDLRQIPSVSRRGSWPKRLGKEIAETVRRTLETRPAGATHWSLRSMAEAVGHAPSTIHRIWKALGLQPHRSETFKLSSDPLFVEKVRDIVGLYLDPPDRAVVLCVDEKSQIQALDRTQPLLPMRPGQAEWRSHDYKRHGTLSLFAALDVQAGKVVGRCFRRHRAQEFRKFLDTVEAEVPDDLDVHLIIDNAGSHKTKRIRDWFAKRPRWHIHFTPTSASWINQVERFFGLLTDRQVRRGVHRSTVELEAAIHAYIDTHNAKPKPFRWTKSADDILAAINRFCRRTLDTHADLRRT